VKNSTTLATLAISFFVQPCFGADWIRDRIYYDLPAYHASYIEGSVGYHYTDNTKISFGVIASLPKYDSTAEKLEVEGGILVKLHYHHEIEGTDITPYITAGIGGGAAGHVKQPNRVITFRDFVPGIQPEKKELETPTAFFAYQVSSGINLPLSSRTSIFTGYRLQKLQKFSHGVEFGARFNL